MSLLYPSQKQQSNHAGGHSKKLIGNRGFGWKLVGESLEVKGNKDGKIFMDACNQKGCVFAFCGIVVRQVTSALPEAFGIREKTSKAGNLPAFKAAHDAVYRLADNLYSMTLRRIETADGKAEKTRQLEHAIVAAIRVIISTQIQIRKHSPFASEERKQIYDNSDAVFVVLTSYLKNAYKDGKFGQNTFQRLGGRMAKFFGSKGKGREQLSVD